MGEAAAERGIPVETLLTDLNRMAAEHPRAEEEQDWTKAESADLIGHIVNTHHRYLREELPEIQKYVTKVSRVHGDADTHLREVERLFGELRRELLEHTDKEEAEEFPKIILWEKSRDRKCWKNCSPPSRSWNPNMTRRATFSNNCGS
ncbi:hypothetical protein HMSSN036_09840 [Paenibacillus macerans]|nr:hypothetical protein HMSSN036_09840 [Paenibacillus macerans]